jgi:hypothetical protein
MPLTEPCIGRRALRGSLESRAITPASRKGHGAGDEAKFIVRFPQAAGG